MCEIQICCDSINNLLHNKNEFNRMISSIMSLIDENNDNVLSYEEVERFITRMCLDIGICQLPTQEKIKELFDEVDTDKNQEISRKELTTFIRNTLERQRNEFTIN